MNLRKAWLTVCVGGPLMAGSAFAQPIPEHMVRNIRISVQTADAVAVMTTTARTGEGPHARVQFKVDQVVMGTLPGELETSLDGFFAPEVEPGTQWLVSLKQLKGSGRYICTGRYERVSEGRVRDYALDDYLNQMRAQISKVKTDRAVAKVSTPSVPSASVPGEATPRPAPVVDSISVDSVSKDNPPAPVPSTPSSSEQNPKT